MILLHENKNIVFIVELKYLEYLPDIGIYKIKKSPKSIEEGHTSSDSGEICCVSLQSIADFYPLERYLGGDYLVLKHTV
jgi:hypothetical protein